MSGLIVFHSEADQRMYKRTESTGDTTAEYYLKNLGIVDLTTGNWTWYVNGVQRTAKITPRSYQQPDSISANMGADSNHVDASFYLYDYLGNTRVVYTPTVRTGCTVLDYTLEYATDYYPYGKLLREFSNGQIEKYLTTQHERDQETGLDYRGARFYDSDVCRFLSLDPAASKYPSISPYSYTLCNPLAFVDPDGRDPIKPTHYTFFHNIGLEIYQAARSQGASPAGALVVLTQASTESGYGSTTVAKEHYNFFGIMGGGSGISTSSGELASYSSASAGINGYFDLLKRRWPEAIEIISQETVTANDWNQALNTGPYEKYPAYFVRDENHNYDYGNYIVNNVLPGVKSRLLETIDYDIANIRSQTDLSISEIRGEIDMLKNTFTKMGTIDSRMESRAAFDIQSAINSNERKIKSIEQNRDAQIQNLENLKYEINGN